MRLCDDDDDVRRWGNENVNDTIFPGGGEKCLTEKREGHETNPEEKMVLTTRLVFASRHPVFFTSYTCWLCLARRLEGLAIFVSRS